MKWLKSLRQWVTSIFNSKQSTKKVYKRTTKKINYKLLGQKLENAMHFMQGEHLYATDVGHLHANIFEWKVRPDGTHWRHMEGSYILTSKTKQFSQRFYARAEIGLDEWTNVSELCKLMEDKTYKMEITYVAVLEDAVGKGKRFPERRGVFNIIRIQDKNDEG